MQQAIIALDLGGTKLASALFADDGQPIGQRAVPLDDRQGKAVGKLIVAQVRRLESLALDRPFRSVYVDCGCFESHASGDGLAKVATRLLTGHKGYRGRLRVKRHITAHDVFDAYEHDDEIAKEVLGQAIEFWGMASANLISMFNPRMLILGGGVFGPATRFLDAIAAEARRWAQPIAMERVKFAASRLGGDAALYGAAYLALKRRVPR